MHVGFLLKFGSDPVAAARGALSLANSNECSRIRMTSNSIRVRRTRRGFSNTVGQDMPSVEVGYDMIQAVLWMNVFLLAQGDVDKNIFGFWTLDLYTILNPSTASYAR